MAASAAVDQIVVVVPSSLAVVGCTAAVVVEDNHNSAVDHRPVSFVHRRPSDSVARTLARIEVVVDATDNIAAAVVACRTAAAVVVVRTGPVDRTAEAVERIAPASAVDHTAVAAEARRRKPVQAFVATDTLVVVHRRQSYQYSHRYQWCWLLRCRWVELCNRLLPLFIDV